LQSLIEEVQEMESMQQEQARGEEEDETTEPTQIEPEAKKKKLELFFEDIMGNACNESNQSVEEIATAEMDRYIAESPESLKSKQPVEITCIKL